MPAAAATIGVSVVAKTKGFGDGMKRANRSLGTFQKQTKRTTNTLSLMGDRLTLIAGTGIAFGFIGALAKGVIALETFNQSMQNSIAIMGSFGQALRKDMTQAAIDMAAQTKFSTTEMGKAYFFLASAGLDAAQAIKALPAVAQFAQAGMFDLAKATDLLTDAQTAYGLSVKDPIKNLKNLVRVSDVLVGANTLAQATVEQFGQALATKAAAKLALYNVSLEEGVAVLAAFAQKGVKGAQAGTALSIVIRDLTTKTIRNAKAFKRLGIEVFDVTTGQLDLTGAIAGLERALDKLSPRMKKVTLLQLGFTDKSLAFLQVLLGSSAEIKRFTAKLKEMGGITDEVANKQLTPLVKGWNEFTAGLSAAAQPLQHVVDLMGKLLGVVGKLAKEFGTPGLATTPIFMNFESPGKRRGARRSQQVKQFKDFADYQRSLDSPFGGAIKFSRRGLSGAQMASEFFGQLFGGTVPLETNDYASFIRQIDRGGVFKPNRRFMRTDKELGEAREKQERILRDNATRRRKIKLSVRTAEERFKQQVTELTQLYGAQGQADIETFTRKMAELRKEFENTTGVALFKDRIASILDGLKTPMDRLRETVSLLSEATTKGVISADQAFDARRRLLEQAADLTGGMRAPITPEGTRSLFQLGGTAGALAVSKAETSQTRQLAELRGINQGIQTLNTKLPGGMGP